MYVLQPYGHGDEVNLSVVIAGRGFTVEISSGAVCVLLRGNYKKWEQL